MRPFLCAFSLTHTSSLNTHAVIDLVNNAQSKQERRHFGLTDCAETVATKGQRSVTLTRVCLSGKVCVFVCVVLLESKKPASEASLNTASFDNMVQVQDFVAISNNFLLKLQQHNLQ